MAWYCIDCGNVFTDKVYASIPGFVCYYCGNQRGSEWLSAVRKLIVQTKQINESSINAPKSAIVNLTVSKELPRGPTAFEKLEKQIGELIKGSKPANLETEDFEYIADKKT